ncbi:hypothetical protein VOLCADRAFT_89690 [Volvox carteri f. nagariensis]|uniref:Uncharacterized protein n=1 Tax=Volvox carteri f. nagariensis TaxID=3068 RepID=D8TRU1_VOLCA|nr:uncharacterized protein VOLCADRAFT_89690 [Volvox carteri f. nagariensis]EFJ49705.1 hypothetical protein VOLCADRAFT_89690 [Volvox carteri f. nagariensis]|eukprot:XP_002949212.1 hypothetical protein VOLCADRAFT_89690 [Volvox carteri f. nagariensis]
MQAVSRLGWFEDIVQQLLEMVSQQEEALSRLEHRAEHASALRAAAGGGAADGILAGIMPGSVLAQAATGAGSAAATGGGTGSTPATAVAPGSGGGGGGGTASGAGGGDSLGSDSLEANNQRSVTQRAASIRFRNDVRAAASSKRFRDNSASTSIGSSPSRSPATSIVQSAAATARLSQTQSYGPVVSVHAVKGVLKNRGSGSPLQDCCFSASRNGASGSWACDPCPSLTCLVLFRPVVTSVTSLLPSSAEESLSGPHPAPGLLPSWLGDDKVASPSADAGPQRVNVGCGVSCRLDA